MILPSPYQPSSMVLRLQSNAQLADGLQHAGHLLHLISDQRLFSLLEQLRRFLRPQDEPPVAVSLEARAQNRTRGHLFFPRRFAGLSTLCSSAAIRPTG